MSVGLSENTIQCCRFQILKRTTPLDETDAPSFDCSSATRAGFERHEVASEVVGSDQRSDAHAGGHLGQSDGVVEGALVHGLLHPVGQGEAQSGDQHEADQAELGDQSQVAAAWSWGAQLGSPRVVARASRRTYRHETFKSAYNSLMNAGAGGVGDPGSIQVGPVTSRTW